MSRERRRSPAIEPMEGRQLLSAVHFDHIAAAARPAPPLVLNGVLNGAIRSFTQSSGTPMVLSESFSGHVRSMGAVRGVIADVIGAHNALLGGGIILRNPRGAVRLAFGPGDLVSTQSIGNISSEVVHYTVADATGIYARSGGSGTFTMLQSMGKSSQIILETTDPVA